MAAYRMEFERTLNSSIVVEAESREEAEKKGWEEFLKSPVSRTENAQDSGWYDVYCEQEGA